MSIIGFSADVFEDDIMSFSKQVMDILLIDRNTKNNLIWATDNYSELGFGYRKNDNIQLDLITGCNSGVIKPRSEKSKDEKTSRKRSKGEVFTPSWICNAQNNLIDSEWFGHESPFNSGFEGGWKTNTEHIKFPNEAGKKWKDYVLDTRMEICCGEAPYLVSRYDSVNGEMIPINERVGLLDRKLRVISENVTKKNSWVEWTYKAYKSTYAYDFQGDNILLARENLLISFVEYYYNKFNEEPSEEYLLEIAYILSWNVWQMDAMKYVVPNSCVKRTEENIQITLFDFLDDVETKKEIECEGCKKNNIHKHTGVYCEVMDWDENHPVKFLSLINRRG